jgi:hypothetical protein
MEMCAGRAARRPDVPDDLAAVHVHSWRHAESGQMSIPRRDSVSVIDDHQISVVAARLRARDNPVGRRVHRDAVVRGDIEPRMEIRTASERVAPCAEGGRQPPDDRPDGLRTMSSRSSRTISRSRSAPNVLSGAANALSRIGPKSPDDEPPPMARDFTIAGSLSIARTAAGSTAACAPSASTAACSDVNCVVSCAVASR